MKTISSTIFLLFFSVSFAVGQPEFPDLELESYRIVGKDTRIFTITGDRYSTVEFVKEPIILPREVRDMKVSRGLIGEDERLHRAEEFSVSHGFHTGVDALSGFKTPLVLWGKASLDLGGKAGTISLSNRTAKLNTPCNNAPLMQDFEAIGYYDALFARFSVDGKYGRENEEVGDEFFRGQNRTVGRYGGGITMRFSPAEKWDASGRLCIKGAGYKDREIVVDNNELVISGDGRASGDLGSTTVLLDASGNYIEMSGKHGTISSLGGMGEWLFGGRFGLKTGASFTASAMPDEDAEIRVYPLVEADWAILPNMYVKASYKPGVVRHSFAELYGLNGLVTFDVPMLFEDRKIDVTGEFGLRHSSGVTGSLEAFYISSVNKPVFTKVTPISDSSAVFFDIVNVGKIDLTGARLKVIYNFQKIWGLDGNINYTSVSSDSTENVPYIPNIEVALRGYFNFYRYWRIRGSIRFVSKHYVESDPDIKETEKSFLTVDLGVDRQLWKRYLSMYVDIRNLMNSDGALWTRQYYIPGFGIYAGLKVDY